MIIPKQKIGHNQKGTTLESEGRCLALMLGLRHKASASRTCEDWGPNEAASGDEKQSLTSQGSLLGFSVLLGVPVVVLCV